MKDKTPFYKEIDKLLSENELLPEHIKTQALNNIKFKANDLEQKTLDKIILNSISTILRIIEDAYNISMYRFQFTLLTNILNKELKTIEDTIAYASEARK